MKVYRLVIMVLAASIGCSEITTHSFNEINVLMQQQQEAWNRGDLEAFMQPYWKNDSLMFIGKRGATYGWNKTLENYQKSYPSKEAMGILKFTNIDHQMQKDFCFVVGKWELFRQTDTLSGHYTLLWRFIDKQWVIVRDHSS